MEKRNKLGLSGLALVLGIYFGIGAHEKIQEAEAELIKNNNYSKSLELKEISSKLNSAKSDLEYRSAYLQMIPQTKSIGKTTYTSYIYINHPEKNPNCQNSREKINSCFFYFDKAEEINQALRKIHDNLPNQNCLKDYNGKSVNNETFSSKRDSLDKIIKRLSELSESYMERIPESLKDKKKNGIIEFLSTLFLVLGSIGYGFYEYNKKN